jgi:hypothetical protein
VFDRTEIVIAKTVSSGFDWSFGNLFKNKKKKK